MLGKPTCRPRLLQRLVRPERLQSRTQSPLPCDNHEGHVISALLSRQAVRRSCISLPLFLRHRSSFKSTSGSPLDDRGCRVIKRTFGRAEVLHSRK